MCFSEPVLSLFCLISFLLGQFLPPIEFFLCYRITAINELCGLVSFWVGDSWDWAEMYLSWKFLCHLLKKDFLLLGSQVISEDPGSCRGDIPSLGCWDLSCMLLVVFSVLDPSPSALNEGRNSWP